MMEETLKPPIWVATQQKLEKVAAELLHSDEVAIDTESNSLHAYQEQVCLIQFSTRQIDYLVDPLALNDLSPVGEILADPKIEKIFHAAEYDLICLKRDYGFTVENIFDTRWAVRLLGYKGDGLERLLTEKFDVKVNKKYQKADWGARPLSDEQINYARLDTHYLLPLKDMLKAELEENRLVQLANEDFQRACFVEIPNGRPDLWERVSHQNSFTLRELTVLKELEACREQIAEDLDRPTFKVVSDKHLFEMAHMLPEYPDELYGIGLSHRQVQRWGKAFLRAIQKGQEAPLVTRPQVERPSDAYLSRMDSLKNWRKHVARKMEVESDVVLPRPLMENLAAEGPNDMKALSRSLVDSPWRMAHFGPQILKALKG